MTAGGGGSRGGRVRVLSGEARLVTSALGRGLEILGHFTWLRLAEIFEMFLANVCLATI